MAWPEPYFKGLRAHWLTTNGDPEQETLCIAFDETLKLRPHETNSYNVQLILSNKFVELDLT